MKFTIRIFLLFSAINFCFSEFYPIEPLNVVKSFERSSAAFWNGESYDSNQKRLQELAIVSASNGVLISDSIGGNPVLAYIVMDDVLYGVVGTFGRACKKVSGGSNWEYTNATQNFSFLSKTSKGTIIGVNNEAKKLYRSIDKGDTFIETTPTGENALSATVFFDSKWSLAEGENGTLLLAEYGPSQLYGGRYIFRSVDDGQTWVRCYDGALIAPSDGNRLYHWHTVGYHSVTKRWIACCGDNIERRAIVYSDDDGLTWGVLAGPTTLHSQPIKLLDYGDSTKLLYGDDGVYTLGLLDVMTGEIQSLYIGVDRHASAFYVFDLAKVGSVYYAPTSTTNSLYKTTTILVSDDIVNWTPYHQFVPADNVMQPRFVGVFGGKIQVRTLGESSSTKRLSISPARIAKNTGTVVSPVATNLLNANDSSMEGGIENWIGKNATIISRSTNEALHGNYSCKVIVPPNVAGTAIYCNCNLSLTAGKKYFGMFAVKGDAALLIPRIYYRSSDGSVQGYRSTEVYYDVGKNWKYIYTEPFTILEGEESYYRFYLSAITGSPGATFYIDCAGIFEMPFKPWYIGGMTQSADVLKEDVSVGKVWSDVFAIHTLVPSLYYDGADKQVIKTWSKDNNKIELSYVPSAGTFRLCRTVDGVELPESLSEAQAWNQNGCIKFCLRVSGNECNLTIQNGRIAEVLSDEGMPALLDTTINGVYGDFAMIVQERWQLDDTYPVWLYDNDMQSALNLMTPDAMKLMRDTGGKVGLFDGSGLFKP